MIFYGVLDVVAKPVFCFIHLFSLSKLDFTVLQLGSGKFTSTVPDNHRRFAGEKKASSYDRHA